MVGTVRARVGEAAVVQRKGAEVREVSNSRSDVQIEKGQQRTSQEESWLYRNSCCWHEMRRQAAQRKHDCPDRCRQSTRLWQEHMHKRHKHDVL